jgi:hypothetical protein
MPSSKTARRSSPTSTSGAFAVDPGVNRLIPLGGGDYAYVLHANGSTSHLAVESEAFAAAVTTLVAAVGAERVQRDFAERIAGPAPQWADVLARLDSAGVFAPEADAS